MQVLEAGVAEVDHASARAKPGSCRQSTALHECVAQCKSDPPSSRASDYLEVCRLLLDAGADPFLENGKSTKCDLLVPLRVCCAGCSSVTEGVRV